MHYATRHIPALMLGVLLATSVATPALDTYTSAPPSQATVWTTYTFSGVPVFDDDAGDRNFVVEAMLLLLGRRPKNADELEVLADLAAEVGRKAVVEVLMEDDDFLLHWTDVLFRLLGVQQTGTRFALEGCFGEPLRTDPYGSPARDGGVLAEMILESAAEDSLMSGRQIATRQRSAPQPFNAVDVAISSLQHGSVWPLLKVVSLSLIQRTTETPGNDETERRMRREQIGRAYMSTLLNRIPECISCHQSVYSVSDAPPTNWDRHHPVPVDLETALIGKPLYLQQPPSAAALEGMFAAFRKDAARLPIAGENTLNEADPTGLRPWGLSAACGTYSTAVTFGPIAGGFLAGETGIPEGWVSAWDLQRVLHASTQDFPDLGLLTGAPANPNAATTLPMPLFKGDAIAYLMALNLVERIWQEVHGSRLTLDHGFPRNADQRAILAHLTNDVFLPSGGSLKALLLDLLVGDLARHFNRVAPRNSALFFAENLPPIYDPWLAEGECPQSPGCANTRGHQVHRYPVRTQLRAVASALGWPAPRRDFAKNLGDSGGSYPSLELLRDLDDQLSEEHPGSSQVGFQSLLAFEEHLGSCSKSDKGVTTDWVDHLVTAIDTHPADAAGGPITLEDVVLLLKDRLIAQPFLEQPMIYYTTGENSEPLVAQVLVPDAKQPMSLAVAPIDPNAVAKQPVSMPGMQLDPDAGAGSSPDPGLHWSPGTPAPMPSEEVALLQAYFFDTPLDADAQALKLAHGAAFEARLRGYCGILLKSPQAMLASLGLERHDRVHPVKVCNPGEPCSYTAWCDHYVPQVESLLDVDLQCHGRSIGAQLGESS